MERIDHLVETFRLDHPEIDPAVLLDFAQHVRRVLIDELREDTKAGNAPVSMSLQLNGASFSAKGPRSYVEELLKRWETAMEYRQNGLRPPGFNRMKLISGR